MIAAALLSGHKHPGLVEAVFSRDSPPCYSKGLAMAPAPQVECCVSHSSQKTAWMGHPTFAASAGSGCKAAVPMYRQQRLGAPFKPFLAWVGYHSARPAI